MGDYELDTVFPLQGTCFKCGRDLRHKLFDQINSQFSAGEPVANLAAAYQVPSRAIEMVLKQNSVTPLGITFRPTLQARSATA